MTDTISRSVRGGPRVPLTLPLLSQKPAPAVPRAEGGVIAPGATLEKLAGGFEFTEGPTSDRDGNVFFTDQPNNRILKWSVDGTLSTFLQPAGRSNGMYFDAGGNLLACADEKTELWSIAPDGTHTVLARAFDGQAAQRPERCLGAAGRRALLHRSVLQARLVGLQHAPAGQRAGLLPVRRSQDAGAGHRPISSSPTASSARRTAGRCSSPTSAPARPTRFDIQPDGSLTNRRLRCELGSDGMTLDTEGNLYLTGQGVSVFDPNGKKIEQIDVPEPWTANVSFGGRDHQTLFITASKGLYAIRLRVRGANAAK